MDRLDLDKILQVTGGCGWYQIRTFILLCCTVMFCTFQMSYIFVARDIKYRCRIEHCDVSLVQFNPEWLINAVPFDGSSPNSCMFYKPQDRECVNFDKNYVYTCRDFIYESNQTTIVQDFEIFCDQNLWKLTLPGTISVLGEAFGLPVAGILSDKFGRKRIIITSTLLSSLSGILRSISPYYSMYLTLEFVDAFLGSGMYTGVFILALEIVNTKRRTFANTVICLAFSAGQIVLAGVAWMSSSWRILLRLLYAPGLILTLLLFLIPESLRWLASKNKTGQIQTLVNAAAMRNGIELSQDVLDELSKLRNRGHEMGLKTDTSVFKSKHLLIRIAHCSYTWISCAFVYYGLTMHSVALSDDFYFDFMCSSLIEIPAYILTQTAMDEIGRKKTLSFSLILGGIACVCVNVIDSDRCGSFGLFLVGKFFVTMAYTTVYVYTTEMFPTKSRHLVFAVCSMFGRGGAMMAPQVPFLARLLESLPLITFSVMAISSGILAFWFPETLSKELPDGVDQAINLAKKES